MNDFSLVDFFNNPSTEQIARQLLGKRIINKVADNIVTSGWIVETEAYLGEIDRAAHSYQLVRNRKNMAMYNQAGTLYVHSMWQFNLINIITQPKGVPEGVLIRAIQPITGLEYMQAQRNTSGINLTNGPGKLTQAMGIQKVLNNTFINENSLSIDLFDDVKTPLCIETSPRIGIPNKGKWTDAKLRYTVAGNPYVSKILKSAMNLNHNGWKEDNK